MYKLYFLIITTFCVLPGYCQTPGRFQNRFDLGHQGKVKTIIDIRYGDNYQYDFDKEGYLVREINTNEYRDYNEAIYEYDKNYTTVKTTYYKDSLIVREVKLVRQTSYKKEWVTIENDTISSYRIKQWNPETKIEWFTELDANRNVVDFGRSQFDDQGNTVKFFREFDSEYLKERPAFPDIIYRINTFNEYNDIVYYERYTCNNDIYSQDGYGAPLSRFPSITKRDAKGNWIESRDEDTVYKRSYVYYD